MTHYTIYTFIHYILLSILALLLLLTLFFTLRKPNIYKPHGFFLGFLTIDFLSYLAYKQQRPPEMMNDDSPFYLAINTEVPKVGKNCLRHPRWE